MDSIASRNTVLSFKIFANEQSTKQEYTLEIRQGHFRFEGRLNESINAELNIGKIRITLYIKPAKIELYVHKSGTEKYALKVSKVQEDEEQYLLDSKV